MSEVTEEEIKAEAVERWPALQPDNEELTYQRSTLRAFCRAAFEQGANWALAHHKGGNENG